ncbi:MAG TPA: TlpA disulfide reductase family protein [Mucilaginibacter sp.]|jgi:peroxiredoxin|nr:TlpA disulfide reductase family protein [Mucilaginibacter sp.]
MTKLLFIITALLPSVVFAQLSTETFTINSKIGKLNAPAKVYLLHQLGNNRIVDSAMIVDGSFSISGSLLEPANAFLVIAHKGEGLEKLDKLTDVLGFFLDKGTMQVTSDKDSVSNAKITGSLINDENAELNIKLRSLNEEANKLAAERNKATQAQLNSAVFQRSLQAQSKTLQDKQRSILEGFVVMHPNSYLSLLVLNQMGRQSGDPFEIDRLYSGLVPSLKDSESGKSLKKSIESAKTTAIGAIAPDFTQADMNGNPVKLSSFRGKYVLIDFWASWCGPCRLENPSVVKAYNKYKTKNFTILGVSLDRPDAKADWLAAIKKDGLAWTQVSDLKFWGNEAAVLYFVQSVPANFLLDPNGKIIAKDLRGTDLEDKLEELFGK